MRANDKWVEECAVFGVSLNRNCDPEAAGIAHNGLLSMQHRGQEGTGIAVVCDNKIHLHKDVGLVSEVFSGGGIQNLPSSRMAVGHNRYSTTGNNTRQNVGPFVTEYLTGRIATAHNGNITNAREIRSNLLSRGLNFDATSDSEVVSSLLAYNLMKSEDSFEGIRVAADMLDGAFSLIILTSDNKLVAVRDPNGFRPLCIGQNESGIALASESCALDSCGFGFVRDVLPGEIVIIQDGQIIQSGVALKNIEKHGGLCIFEYVYFARPDSVIDNLSVYEARYNMGARLAEEFPVEADAVCGVPDSGLEAALGYSAKSGIPLITGFVKNRYIGRSFIYPTQSQRESAVRMKLNPLSVNVAGKRIVLIDDSIVRGTTSAKIVRLMKNAGAKEVHMRVSSPPFRYTCHFGTDIDSEENLIANMMSLEDICKAIGADSLGFISIDGLKSACAKCSVNFCTNCFTGGYRQKSLNKSVLENE